MESFDLKGKSALVTGSATGIGQAIAVAMAEAGADVACHCRKPGDAAETVAAIEKIGHRAVEVMGNMAEREAPAAVVEASIAAFGQIDILINNAGMIRRSPAVDYSEKDWAIVIEVTLSSVFRMSQAAGRHMIGRGSGKIVNIASLLSFQGGITVPAYTAS